MKQSLNDYERKIAEYLYKGYGVNELVEMNVRRKVILKVKKFLDGVNDETKFKKNYRERSTPIGGDISKKK